MQLRTKIAIIAVTCLVLGGGLFFFSPEESSVGGLQGALVKVGAVMSMLWLAFPQLEKLPAWMAIAIGIGAIVAAIYRKYALIIIPILIVVWFIRPRHKPPAQKKRTAKSSPKKKQQSNVSKEKSSE